MTQPLLPLAIAPPVRRRGRPPGARNRRSADLARYVEATYGGMTPGQQAAELAMVRPADLKRAKAEAKDLGVVDLDLPALTLAMVVKASKLAQALGIDRADAWVLLMKERAELMPYIHQKQPQAQDAKGVAPATVFLVPEGEAVDSLPDMTAGEEPDIELLEDFGAPSGQVGSRKSDEPT